MWEVEWEPEATSAAAAHLADRAGLAEVFDTLERLAVDPYDMPAFEMGHSDRRRLRVGDYRVVVQLEQALRKIRVVHLGRLPSS